MGTGTRTEALRAMGTTEAAFKSVQPEPAYQKLKEICLSLSIGCARAQKAQQNVFFFIIVLYAGTGNICIIMHMMIPYTVYTVRTLHLTRRDEKCPLFIQCTAFYDVYHSITVAHNVHSAVLCTN